jgi:hypothetical protein
MTTTEPHDHDDDEPICVRCAARDIAFKAVDSFSADESDVKMSFDQWHFLMFAIEREVRVAFGVPPDDSEPEPGTAVQ